MNGSASRADNGNPTCHGSPCEGRGRPIRMAGATAWWGMALLVLALGSLAVCPGGSCTVPRIDQAMLAHMQALQQPWLTGLFGAATWLGSIATLLPASLAMAWHLKRSGDARAALLLPLSVSGAWVIAHIAKLVVARPRPDLFPALIAMPADAAFPSAHAMQVAAFAVALACTLGARRHGVVASITMAVLVVALSRLYLQVHFPSDVLFGLAAGAAWALGLQRLIPRPR